MEPISSIGIKSILQDIKPESGPSQTAGSSFANIFENAIKNVKDTEDIARHDELLVATGEVDDLHTVMINATKAELALSMLVQVRNKALDAYNEVMNMTV